MTKLALGTRIWFFTVLGTVFFFDMKAILYWGTEEVSEALAIFFFGMIFGLLVTLPLLLPTVWFVGMMARLPYSLSAAVVWLWSMLVVLVIISIVSVVWIVDGCFPNINTDVISFIGAVLLSLLIVLLVFLPALRKFSNTVRAKQLQQEEMA